MYNIVLFTFYHKPFENNLDRDIYIPFYIGNPKNNTQNFIMDVNYPKNLNYLNPKINEFTGIYCILNNFKQICLDLKINEKELDFFGFQHYSRIFKIDLNNLQKDKGYIYKVHRPLTLGKMFAYALQKINNPIIRKIVGADDCTFEPIIYGTEQIIASLKIIPDLLFYVNKWKDIVEELINDVKFTKQMTYFMSKYIYFMLRIDPTADSFNYLLHNLSERMYGYLTEYMMGKIYHRVLNDHNILVVSPGWCLIRDVLYAGKKGIKLKQV